MTLKQACSSLSEHLRPYDKYISCIGMADMSHVGLESYIVIYTKKRVSPDSFPKTWEGFSVQVKYSGPIILAGDDVN